MKVAAFGTLEDFVAGTGKETIVELEVRVLIFHSDGLVG